MTEIIALNGNRRERQNISKLPLPDTYLSQNVTTATPPPEIALNFINISVVDKCVFFTIRTLGKVTLDLAESIVMLLLF